jgi:hypothetical protein
LAILNSTTKLPDNRPKRGRLSIVYVVGGQQKSDAKEKEEFHGYQKGVILEVDTEEKSARTCLEYVSPPEVCPATDPSILFKAATVTEGKIYLCTQTEIMIFSFPAFKQQAYISLPCFNDIHHVRPTPEGNLLVTNTGLDMVLEITTDGEILREWDVLDEPLWSRFSKDTDYRKMPTTKPHKSHPNFTFFVGEDIWVTRFKQKDAVCLTNNGKITDIGVCGPHDGQVYGGKVYFTTVDSHLVVADPKSKKVLKTAAIKNAFKRPSWCRGIHVLDSEHVLMGFSRLRYTRWGDNVSWLKGGVNAIKEMINNPASIALYNHKRGKILWNMRLDVFGISAIFSIHPGPSSTGA